MAPVRPRLLAGARYGVLHRGDLLGRHGLWGWLDKCGGPTGLLALYRAAFFYGCCRWVAWMIWAHVIHDYPYDPSWGGPHWAPAAHP